MSLGISLAARARWAGLPLSTLPPVQLAGEDSANATSEMSSTEAHIKLVNTLMASDRVWEATIDSLPDAVYIFGADKRLKKINHAGESLEQAQRAFLSGRRCCDMLWGLAGVSCMVDRAMSNGAAIEVEIPAENKAQRPLLVRVVPQTGDPQHESATGCIVIARD